MVSKQSKAISSGQAVPAICDQWTAQLQQVYTQQLDWLSYDHACHHHYHADGDSGGDHSFRKPVPEEE